MATTTFRREAGYRPAHGPEAYIDRELSWLAFNRRVLEEAQHAANPLIERAKFLAIVSSNLDEFVMVRLAELRSQAAGKGAEPALRELLRRVRGEIRRLVADQYGCWRQVATALRAEGFSLVPSAEWSEADRETLSIYFRDQLEPVLTPLAVDPTRPFPLVKNRGLTVAVRLVSEQGGEERNALVAVPAGARLVGLIDGGGRWALLEDVVMAFCDRLFPGHRITNRCLFRPTRDGSIEIDEQEAEDLLSELEQELASREHGHVVRLELSAEADAQLRAWLVETMGLSDDELVTVDGPLDLTMLFGVGERLPGRDDLRDPPLVQAAPPGDWEDVFARLRQGEVLLHHPYQTFQPVVDLIERAADDPRVLAIKQTLYRTSGNSPIARALMRAAKAGKQVTVLVELKARFDEAANIRWARALEEAGAHVVYGLVGYKVHAKLLMVIRRDEDGIRRYCHLGTGNYNERTARLYTDLSYLTCNEAVGRDMAALFNMLTGYSLPPEWERLAVAPLTMRTRFVEWIRREAAHGRKGRIIAKFNSLVDHGMCDELYAASRAGVQIDLIVRGMCILRAGVPGLSENIRLRSIVGRFLEHSRIYYFANRGAPVYAMASADWMTRNLDYRVESAVQITDPALQREMERILAVCLEDDVQAREMRPDGSYERLRPRRGKAGTASQVELAQALARAAQRGGGEAKALPFTPVRKAGKR
ncbi:MAG: polyphosphate kinase 1 [Planctomycetes bacterium]|nr:polyphosphate kinase 1 [Planctomycetota bacterium]